MLFLISYNIYCMYDDILAVLLPILVPVLLLTTNTIISQRIYQKYAGDKNILIVEGDHNSARPRYFFDSASIFLSNVLQVCTYSL